MSKAILEAVAMIFKEMREEIDLRFEELREEVTSSKNRVQTFNSFFDDFESKLASLDGKVGSFTKAEDVVEEFRAEMTGKLDALKESLGLEDFKAEVRGEVQSFNEREPDALFKSVTAHRIDEIKRSFAEYHTTFLYKRATISGSAPEAIRKALQ